MAGGHGPDQAELGKTQVNIHEVIYWYVTFPEIVKRVGMFNDVQIPRVR